MTRDLFIFALGLVHGGIVGAALALVLAQGTHQREWRQGQSRLNRSLPLVYRRPGGAS